MNIKKALLLVMMEPPTSLEDEFHDWYDLEHLPQRRSLPGVERGARWVCIDGWPRWMAEYDLSSEAALETPEYMAVSGSNSTPWSRRILPRMIGRTRICAELIGDEAETAPAAAPVRILLLRFPQINIQECNLLMAEVRRSLAAIKGLSRLRFFTVKGSAATDDLLVLAGFDRPVSIPAVGALIQNASAGADLVNWYLPYHRA